MGALDIIIDQIKSCKFECEAGPLELNTGWIQLLEYIECLQEEKEQWRALYNQALFSARRILE